MMKNISRFTKKYFQQITTVVSLVRKGGGRDGEYEECEHGEVCVETVGRRSAGPGVI